MSVAEFWKDDRKRTWFYFFIVVVLLVIAVMAPLTANIWFGYYKPSTDSSGQWFQRSGAITTVFALLALAVQTAGSKKLWVPGFFIGAEKKLILESFSSKFTFCENTSFLLTVIGTMIWGYGDVFLVKAVTAICTG